jgi:hypothetical protein
VHCHGLNPTWDSWTLHETLKPYMRLLNPTWDSGTLHETLEPYMRFWNPTWDSGRNMMSSCCWLSAILHLSFTLCLTCISFYCQALHNLPRIEHKEFPKLSSQSSSRLLLLTTAIILWPLSLSPSLLILLHHCTKPDDMWLPHPITGLASIKELASNFRSASPDYKVTPN